MSLSTGFTWTHKGIKLIGFSLAGVTTSIAFPDADVCFDVGQGLPFQIPYSKLLITHGHMDHASGLPYLIGQKSMTGAIPPTVYMPEKLIKPMREIMRVWGSIEDHSYTYDFRVPVAGERYDLNGSYFFRTCPSFHRVPSQGYTVFEQKKRLLAQNQGLTPQELGALRKEGMPVDEIYEEAVLSFSGDSTIEFLDSEQVKKSRVIVMEVTYWDKQKSVENARQWGHIHLDELLPRLDQLKCEKLVLIHASARYTTAMLNKIMIDRIPEHWKHRVDLFPRSI